MSATAPTIFLLSPARCSTTRALALIEARSSSEVARLLHSSSGAPLGDVFAFLSSLYFRGKLTYARTFARPAGAAAGVYVITPGAGLLVESQRIDAAGMRAFATTEVHHENDAFCAPLVRDAQRLLQHAGPHARFVLLGSIASAKYVAPLQQALDNRLLFPADFVGRGDMSRGGLLLRCASEARELAYVPVLGATLHGPRPAKLPPLRSPAAERSSRPVRRAASKVTSASG